MKANEAPEKLYLSDIQRYFDDKDVNASTIRYADDDVEYIQTNAFIEKVARFLENKLYDRVEIQVWGTVIPSLTSKKAFIDEFVNYMKGE